jgi:hypothetical protein
VFAERATRRPKPGENPDPTPPKAWKKDEVDSVSRVFKAIPPADKDVLRNINLSWVTSLPAGNDTLAEFQDAAAAGPVPSPGLFWSQMGLSRQIAARH